jgi:CheY-like chemotaxis protein
VKSLVKAVINFLLPVCIEHAVRILAEEQSCQRSMHLEVCNFEQTELRKSAIFLAGKRGNTSRGGERSGSMPRILLAEDDDAVRAMLQAAMERDGFEVAAVANVRDALYCIATEKFDAVLSDLHMPQADDGFTVVSAMRHTNPLAATLVLSGYPAVDEALSAIRLQADEVLMKPIHPATLREAIRNELANPVAHRPLPTESVASILEHDLSATIQDWMARVEIDKALTCIPLSFEDRTGHLPNLIADLIFRLRLPGTVNAQRLRLRTRTRESEA